MKKTFMFFLILPLLLSCFACERTAPTETAAAKAVIDYGHSQLYSTADMDAAIRVIEKEFSTWDQCELLTIAYGSDDECNDSNLAWLNELAAANDAGEPFTQCILFVSSFRTPKHGYDAFEADTQYTGWNWWLARTEGGSWKLMTWGYA